MQAVDAQGTLGKYLFDKSRSIPQAHLNGVCKFHQVGACRYIGLGVKGFVCFKRTKMKPFLDQQVDQQAMTARGDNCEGLGEPDIESPQPGAS